MEALVLSKPYPDYTTMTHALENDKAYVVNGGHYGLVWGAEYSAANHERCKRMYESLLNKEVCIQMGNAINKDGGFDAMRACYYILLHFTKSPEIKVIQYYWNGIGDWGS